MPKYIFNSIDEIKEFVGLLKGARGGKTKADDGETGSTVDVGNLPGNGQAPPPLMPTTQQLQAATGMNGAAPAVAATVGQSAVAGAFPGGGPMPGADPAAAALVQRIAVRVDGAITSGQPAESITQWLRNACGQVDANAAQADLATLKAVYLPKMPPATLEAMAKQMNA